MGYFHLADSYCAASREGNLVLTVFESGQDGNLRDAPQTPQLPKEFGG
jgi:hypothetical protein